MTTSYRVPIPKGRNINVTDSENYRGAALSSVVGRIFDIIVLARYSDSLESCDLQFGFKKNRSAAMCTMIVKEAISYYTIVSVAAKKVQTFFVPVAAFIAYFLTHLRRSTGLNTVSFSDSSWTGGYRLMLLGYF